MNNGDSYTADINKLQTQLLSLRIKKQKALDMLLDDKIDQESYDTVVRTINPKIDSLAIKFDSL